MWKKKKKKKTRRKRAKTPKSKQKKAPTKETRAQETPTTSPMTKQEKILLGIAFVLCISVFGAAVYHHYSSYPGVWVIEPFFVETKMDYGMEVLKIYPRNEGNRYFLYGDYVPIPTDNTTLIALNQERIVIEGVRTFRYSRRPLHIWIDVDRMYPYSLCLDEEGYLERLPYLGDIP